MPGRRATLLQGTLDLLILKALSAGAAARARRLAPHRADHRRHVRRATGLALPRAPSSGGSGLAHVRLAALREQPAREVLHAHEGRTPAAGRRGRPVEPDRAGHRARAGSLSVMALPVQSLAQSRAPEPRRSRSRRGAACHVRVAGRREGPLRHASGRCPPRRPAGAGEPGILEGRGPRRARGCGRGQPLPGHPLRAAAVPARARLHGRRGRRRWPWASAPTPPCSAS